MKEDQKAKRLRLWKTRQEADGYDVSGVTTLEQAEHFFDKKDTPAEAPEAQEEPKDQKGRETKKHKEV